MRSRGSSSKPENAALAPTPDIGVAFEKWLEHFYKECGREITLAYTTLNQMKNWAVVIVGAALSAVVAISKTGDVGQRGVAVFVGAAVAYVFALRFFMRAIICYNNLIRWNNLQKSIISYKLVAAEEQITADQLKESIRQLYHEWRVPSTMSRWKQLRDNLKLGFGLLLLFPVVFAATFAGDAITTYFGAAVAVFCAGYTVVEFADFVRSPLFDTPEAYKRRPSRTGTAFPTPDYGSDYLKGLALTFGISCLIAFWPHLRDALVPLLSRLRVF